MLLKLNQEKCPHCVVLVHHTAQNSHDASVMMLIAALQQIWNAIWNAISTVTISREDFGHVLLTNAC